MDINSLVGKYQPDADLPLLKLNFNTKISDGKEMLRHVEQI